MSYEEEGIMQKKMSKKRNIYTSPHQLLWHKGEFLQTRLSSVCHYDMATTPNGDDDGDEGFKITTN